MKICSISNIFNQLIPASIYNISVSIHRDPYENIILWKQQTVFKLVNTSKSLYSILILIKIFFFEKDPSPLRIRTWKNNENFCGAELLNSYSLLYSTECILNERIFNCNKLDCGCRYQFKLIFNQANFNSLCLSISQCDIQLNNPNFTSIQFQTRK